MAGVSECFGIGSVVSCKTCYNKELEGEVLAFDPHTKMLILKSPASNGQSKLNDVHVINLSLVSDINVKKEVITIPEPPQSLNLQRINTRAKNQVEEKRRLVSALKAGVSPEGQNLFLSITKTIGDVVWQGADIIVLKQVAITPPYLLENVRLLSGVGRGPGGGANLQENRTLTHVCKLVEKHFKDQQAAASGGASNNTPSSSPAPVTNSGGK